MDKKFEVTALFEGRECAQFTEQGMAGVERKNPNRPVSLISLEARQSVDAATLRGICYRRFTADITVACDQMPDTDTILEAADLQLGILPERKRCWPECVLLQQNLPCPLIDGVRYAYVESPGKLCLGESFTVRSKSAELDES